MRFARLVVPAVAFVAVLTWGAGSAWASATTTIDSVSGGVQADTSGEVTGASDCTTSQGFSDPHQVPSGTSGPFFFNQSSNPATATASCSAGSGSNSSSANLTSVGSIDATTGALSLTQQSRGNTDANGTLTNPQGCVDFGGGASSLTDVTFTITRPMPFNFSGTFTTTQPSIASFSLTEQSPFTTIFDSTSGLTPNASGTLQPGTYHYLSRADVSNDVACGSGHLTDSFSYRLDLEVGGDHYQIEFKAWIAQPHVVDPYQPITLPTPLTELPPLSLLRPLCIDPPLSNGTVSTTFRGDGHSAFAGTFRADVVIDFDWDGTQIKNFTVSPNSQNFGITRLDFHIVWDPFGAGIASEFVSVDCTTTGQATQSAVGSQAFGHQGFLLALDAADPLVSPQFAVPALDGQVMGVLSPTPNGVGATLNIRFTTDIFPSFGLQVTRDGVVQATSLLNDTSCMDPNSVLGPLGIPALAFGLSSITQNTGSFTIFPGTSGASSSRSSDLCSQSYDTLQFINSNSTIPFPAGDVTGSAAAASRILVAPAGSSRFIPLSQALKQGLVAGVQHTHMTSLLVDPKHPVRIKVIGRGVIAQEFTLHKGRLGKGLRFGPVTGTLIVSAGKRVTATLNGHKLKARKPDRKPPHTTATVKIKGKFAIVHLHATDASGVARTILIVGGKVVKLKHGSARIALSQLGHASYYSIDVLGNVERARRLKR